MSAFRNRPSTLSFSLRSRLGTYSASAVTGALSIASSDAAIVYVSAESVLTDVFTFDGDFATYNVDLNSDTIPDLRLWTKDGTGTGVPTDNDAVLTAPLGPGLSVDVIAGTAAGFIYPSRLNAGALIDESAVMHTLPQVSTAGTVGWLADGNANPPPLSAGYTNSAFKLAPNNTGYLGVRFKISGNDHYGWLRITVKENGAAGSQPRSITLHGYAYETIPGRGIVAGTVPEPTSLGLLALGSAGLAAHRRRRAQPAGD